MVLTNSPKARISVPGKCMPPVVTNSNKLTFTSVSTNAKTTDEVSIEPIEGMKRRMGTNTGLVTLTKNCESGLLKLARAKPNNKRMTTAPIYSEKITSIKNTAICEPIDNPSTEISPYKNTPLVLGGF